MRALLDTNVLIWLSSEPERISSTARALLEDTRSDFFVSTATVWELAIKFNKGTLELDGHPGDLVPELIDQYGLHVIDVSMEHALRTIELPHHHRDPFDRMLVAQAQVESCPILSPDKTIARYDVEVVW